MKAPFPWFGGKSRCAHMVWQRFGNVPNYVEPFFGSGAVLLARPHPPRTETINDKDCYVANFWRATRQDPEQVARHADWPVNEADLHARHLWLVEQADFRARMMRDPDYFDARIAGWWVWGISQWIGSGWCSRPEWMGRFLPRTSRGIQTDAYNQRPNLTRTRDISASNNWKKRPSLERGGRGISRMGQWQTRPFLTGSNGVHALRGQLPQLSGSGSGSGRGVLSRAVSKNLLEYMMALSDRLRRARVCCGDWQRILGPSPTSCIGVTAVFLDPPYSAGAQRDPSIYNHDSLEVGADVARWALANGANPRLRIALCGYEGEHKMPRAWICVPWKANGGYGNQSHGTGRSNAGRERIWFSPHCLRPEEQLL
jgi:hypothetical protein